MNNKVEMFNNCPCCGNKPTLLMRVPYGHGNYGFGATHIVMCSNDDCKLMMKSNDISYVSKKEEDEELCKLANRWNRRANN
jgi:hypothetical protein